ncbi:MAG TPA: ABC transporter permease [Candidatus Dormibacteraeota bacterium]|jgi:sulfonate transport system permease protein
MAIEAVVRERPAGPPPTDAAAEQRLDGRSRRVHLTVGKTAARRHDVRFLGGLRRTLVPLALIAVWEIGSSSGWWSSLILPSPLAIGSTFVALVRDGTLPQNLAVSLQRVVIGAGIGITTGITLGIVSGLWRIGEESFDAILQMMRTLPYLVMLPLFVIWFGIDEFPKILIIAIGTSMPMYLNTFSGVRNVDRRLVEMAQSFGLNRVRLILTVIIPGAMPSILTGLRYSLGVGWLALVVAEQINARAGLGFLISDAQSLFLTDVLLVCVVTYAALGLLSDVTARLLERRLLSWRGSSQRW